MVEVSCTSKQHASAGDIRVSDVECHPVDSRTGPSDYPKFSLVADNVAPINKTHTNPCLMRLSVQRPVSPRPMPCPSRGES
jgi:hypothetical protein